LPRRRRLAVTKRAQRPARDAPPSAPSSTVPRVTLTESPRNWQLLDEIGGPRARDQCRAAMTQLLAGKAPKQTVLVAIIDNGIDTSHADLRANLWENPKEVGGNGKDDDNNGFADDVHGWNSSAARTARTSTGTRSRSRENTPAVTTRRRPAAFRRSPTRRDVDRWTRDYDKQRKELEANVGNYRQAHDIYQQILPVLASAAHVSADSLTAERVRMTRRRIRCSARRARSISTSRLRARRRR
jgi:hypothetical protein